MEKVLIEIRKKGAPLFRLPSRSLGNNLGNLGVVNTSVNLLGTDSYGKAGDIAIAVTRDMPSHLGTFRHNAAHSDSQLVIILI